MKAKKIVSAFLCLLVCGCTVQTKKTLSNESISEKVIKMNYDQKCSVQYPRTPYKKVNKEIKNILHTYENKAKKIGKDDVYPEFNVSYHIPLQNSKYMSVVFYIYLHGEHPIEDIRTILYDVKNEKILNLEDLLNEQQLTNISNEMISYFKNTKKMMINDNFRIHSAPIMKNYQNFSISPNSIKFYFPPDTLFHEKSEFKYPVKNNKIIQAQNEEILYEPFETIDQTKPMIALTFDDGPHKGTTNRILKILSENNARATFFVLGTNIENNEELIKQAIFQGNEIGNHTYSHRQLTKLNKVEIEEEIQQTQDMLKNNIHYQPKVLRPPYGSHNQLVDDCAKSYRLVTWSLDTLDWKYRNTDKVVNKVISTVKEGDIILMHDLYESTVDAVSIIIPMLQKKGFQFVTVSELYTYYGDKVRES